MPHYSANLAFLFTEEPFLDRFEAAACAGFRAVEFPFPYSVDEREIALRLQDNDLAVSVFNMPPGNWDGGDRGLAVRSDRKDEFARSIDLALKYADALDCQKIHCMAGIPLPGTAPEAAHETLLDSFSLAAEKFAPEGISLMIEPLNTIEMPHYAVSSPDYAVALIEAIGRSRSGLQYDFYHMTLMGEDHSSRLPTLMPLIDHIQIADAPGRHEPGSGSIPFDQILPAIESLGYSGWIGCEYVPASTTREGLHWRSNYMTSVPNHTLPAS